VHNEVRSGRPSVITKDLKDRVDAHIHENRQFTIDELHGVSTLCFVTSPLQDCHSSTPIQKKLYQTGSKMLTDKHKQLRIG
jgi:hypothetical protein